MSDKSNNDNDPDEPPPLVHNCAVCSKEASHKCSKCKVVWYCSRPCQVQDWKEGHKGVCCICAVCDECKNPDVTNHPCTNCCMACGHLFCDACGENYIQRDSPDRRPGFRGNITGFSPCPSCGNPSSLNFVLRENWKSMEALFYDKVDDPRRGTWMLLLGVLHLDHGYPFETVKKYLLIAATDGGMAEGYSRLAEEYAQRRDWAMVTKYYEMAGKLNHPVALHSLTVKAIKGFFFMHEDLWGPQNPSDQSPVDIPRALQLNKRAVKLLYPPACGLAAENYFGGRFGVAQNSAKAYECAVLALEKQGHPQGHEPSLIRVLVGLSAGLTPTLHDQRATEWIEANRQDYRYGPLIRNEERRIQALSDRMQTLSNWT